MASQAGVDFHGNTLLTREVSGFAIKELRHAPGIRLPRHSHERAHVALVVSGVFTETCERKTLECRPLSVSFLAPGISHSDNFRGGAHCLLVDIAPHRLDQLRDVLPLDEPVFVPGGVSSWLMMRLYAESRQQDGASSLAMEGLALEVLAEVSRHRPGRVLAVPRWMAQVQELLHANFRQRLTHDEIALAVGIHPVHLAHAFRRQFNCTIGEYVRRLRVEHASLALASSDASLVEIALASGFSDQSHFSKLFKRLAGMTPSQFRASLRGP